MNKSGDPRAVIWHKTLWHSWKTVLKSLQGAILVDTHTALLFCHAGPGYSVTLLPVWFKCYSGVYLQCAFFYVLYARLRKNCIFLNHYCTAFISYVSTAAI